MPCGSDELLGHGPLLAVAVPNVAETMVVKHPLNFELW